MNENTKKAHEQYKSYYEQKSRYLDIMSHRGIRYQYNGADDLAHRIIEGQGNKYDMYNGNVYPLSEKQIAVVEGYLARLHKAIVDAGYNPDDMRYGKMVDANWQIVAKVEKVAEAIETVEATEEIKEIEISGEKAVAVSHGFLRTGSTIMDAEYQTRFYSDEEIAASTRPPARNQPVTDKEAEALRNGQPYQLSEYDLNRLFDAGAFGNLDGDDNDPFIIKGLARGLIIGNPKYVEELAQKNAIIEEMKQECIARGDYHEGVEFSVGVGMNNSRWLLTPAGKQWKRENLA